MNGCINALAVHLARAMSLSISQVVGSNPTFCCLFSLFFYRFPSLQKERLQKLQFPGVPSTRSSNFWVSPTPESSRSSSFWIPQMRSPQKLQLLDVPDPESLEA